VTCLYRSTIAATAASGAISSALTSTLTNGARWLKSAPAEFPSPPIKAWMRWLSRLPRRSSC
jgi:hypothetical protein